MERIRESLTRTDKYLIKRGRVVVEVKHTHKKIKWDEAEGDAYTNNNQKNIWIEEIKKNNSSSI